MNASQSILHLFGEDAVKRVVFKESAEYDKDFNFTDLEMNIRSGESEIIMELSTGRTIRLRFEGKLGITVLPEPIGDEDVSARVNRITS